MYSISVTHEKKNLISNGAEWQGQEIKWNKIKTKKYFINKNVFINLVICLF